MTHSVILHLLARKNKKIPLKDGKKIVLVVPGGLMSGVCGAGAMIGLYELGFANAFDSMYVISAGLPNALYYASKQGRVGTSIYYEDCSGRKLINLARVWKMVNIDYLVHVFRFVKTLDVDAVLAAKTKIYVRLTDIRHKKVVYLEVHDVPKNEYFGLLEAALSVPYLHPGSTKIRGNQYKDPGFQEHQLVDHIQRVLDSDATDIVIIYNHLGQVKSVRKTLHLPESRVLEIMPKPEWKISRFETNPEKLKDTALKMGGLVKELFGEKKGITLSYENGN